VDRVGRLTCGSGIGFALLYIDFFLRTFLITDGNGDRLTRTVAVIQRPVDRQWCVKQYRYSWRTDMVVTYLRDQPSTSSLTTTNQSLLPLMSTLKLFRSNIHQPSKNTHLHTNARPSRICCYPMVKVKPNV
jgi:hypothetical protein